MHNLVFLLSFGVNFLIFLFHKSGAGDYVANIQASSFSRFAFLVFLLNCCVNFLISLFQEVARAREEFMETFRSLRLPLFVTTIVDCHHFDSLSFFIIATVTISNRIFAEPQPTGFLASLPPVLFRTLKRLGNKQWLLSKQQNHVFTTSCITSFLQTIRWQPPRRSSSGSSRPPSTG